MSSDSRSPADRTRPHPEERFAPQAQSFDLTAAARELAAEVTSSAQRHRQKTLYRHGNSSLALFLFEAGAGLKEHSTNGTVFIQVLAGRIIVRAQGDQYELDAGNVLVMAPCVPHAVDAEQASQMLLTVSLLPSDQQAAR
jgi:quercetin dioxygenase-like cupin family protein